MYALPLKVPPGINGLTPELTLRYNSGAIEAMNQNIIQGWGFKSNPGWPDSTYTDLQASCVGLGWSLDVGAVTTVDGGPVPLRGGRFDQLLSSDGVNFHTRGRPVSAHPSDDWLAEQPRVRQYALVRREQGRDALPVWLQRRL